MWVASLFPFVVGIVRWHAPEHQLTVVVKATYDLSTSGVAQLNASQLGLAGDHRGILPAGDPTLEHASDFAPLKAQADVLLVGHAHVATTVSTIPIALRVDDLLKRAVVRCPTPSKQALLCGDGITGEGEPTLGPRAAVRTHVDKSLDAGFDFGAFNVAPADQQVAHLSSAAQLGLTGLLRGGVHRDVRLPGHRPEVYFAASRMPDADARQIALVCDTLWIHSDREIATLCWRGSLPIGNTAGAEAFVAVSERSRGQGWELLDAQLDDAQWMSAQEQPPSGAPIERTLPTVGLGDDATPSSRTAPFSLEPDSLEPDTARRGSPHSSTLSGESESTLSGESEPGPATRAPHTVAATLDNTTRAPALPFQDGPIKDLPPAIQRAIAAMGTQTSPTGTLAIQGDEPDSEALPFADDDDDDRPTNRPPPDSGHTGETITQADDDDDPRPQELIEPAPETPRAGVRLGDTAGGGGLGGFTLSSGQRPDESLPFQSNAASAPAEPPSRPEMGTQTGTMSLQDLIGPALPFGGKAGSAPPAPANLERPAVGGQTMATMDRAALGLPPSGELPFGPRGAPRAEPPPSAAPMTAPPERLAPATDQPPYAVAPARPSSPGFSARAAQVPAPSQQPSQVPSQVPSQRHTPTPSPPPPKPEPTPRLPVKTFAAIKAALMNGDRPLAEVLDEHRLDERRWRASERRMSLDLAHEARDGQTELATELRQAIEQARNASQPQPSSEDLELEEYAALRAEIDEADDPRAVMLELGLDDARWTAMRRTWSRRCLADRALATRLREALTSARGRLRKQRGNT